jgi:ABC-2 type transport system permease protein
METQRELNNILTIAVKEFMDNVKSKRFILIGVLYMGMALLLTGVTVLSVNGSNVQTSGFKPSYVLSMIDILNIILALLAVIVTADTISIEKKDRTIYQLLSKPVERTTVVLGKFLGCLGIISFLFILSSLVAYLLTAVLTGAYPNVADLMVSLEAIVFLVVLFAVYVGIGVLISTVTKNPLISIIGGIIVWVALFFMNIFGRAIGSLSLTDSSIYLMGDPFTMYPLYAKVLVWLDPISHDIVSPLLNGGTDQVGLSFWANVVILLAYTGILLVVSTELFKRQDL